MNNMANENLLEQQVEELKSQLANAREDVKEIVLILTSTLKSINKDAAMRIEYDLPAILNLPS